MGITTEINKHCLWFLSQMAAEIVKGVVTFNDEETNSKRNKEIRLK